MTGKLKLPNIEQITQAYDIDLQIDTDQVEKKDWHSPGDMIYVVLPFNGSRSMAAFRWGFQPQATSALPTARVETVNLKNLWRLPFERQRCIVPILGFEERGEFVISDSNIISVAAIYTPGSAGRGPQVAILTTPSIGDMAGVANRVPAVVAKDQWRPWLKGNDHTPSELQRLLITHDPGYKLLV